jgi:hypothetical protein
MMLKYSVLIALSVPASAYAADEPYALKGVQLGITLEEFKAIPVPIEMGRDGEEKSRKEFRLPPLKRTLTQKCSDQALVLQCQWVQIDQNTGLPSLSGQAQQIRTQFGDISGYFSFDFVSAPDGQRRLARIHVRANNQPVGGLLEALTVKYGQPVQSLGQVQNGYGATFEKLTMKWSNTVSQIEVQTRCPELNSLCVDYTHPGLLASTAAPRREAARRAADDL